MKSEYDLSKMKPEKNPYVRKRKKATHWIIEGYKSTTVFFTKRIPIGRIEENQMKTILMVLAGKHGLTEGEIIASLQKKRTIGKLPFLEVRKSADLPYYLSCGEDPHFTARVE